MENSSLTFTLAKWLYPLPTIPRTRTKELKVICLGFPRSGTESLYQALRKLGYDDVTHGFVWWLQNVQTSVLWIELALLRAQGRTPDPETLRTKYFDRVLGIYEGTTDIPTIWFAEELLLAYPKVKVVLNRRTDVEAWKRSFRDAVLPIIYSWKYWFWSWFQAELFWGHWLTLRLHWRDLFRRDFEKNAVQVYTSHYARLEKALEESGRAYLEWSVEDGWEPLCKFLDKPTPSVPFPKGNVAADFFPKIAAVDSVRFRQAKRNAAVVGLALAVGISGWVVNARSATSWIGQR